MKHKKAELRSDFRHFYSRASDPTAKHLSGDFYWNGYRNIIINSQILIWHHDKYMKHTQEKPILLSSSFKSQQLLMRTKRTRSCFTSLNQLSSLLCLFRIQPWLCLLFMTERTSVYPSIYPSICDWPVWFDLKIVCIYVCTVFTHLSISDGCLYYRQMDIDIYMMVTWHRWFFFVCVYV